MKKNFDENFNILQKEIFDITKNIDKVQKKNHQTMSKIVQKLKFINKETKPFEENTNNSSLVKINNTEYIQCKSAKNLKLNNYLSTYNNKNIYSKEETNGNYKKHQPAIQLYKNYTNKITELNNNTQFNNCPNKTFNNTTDNSNSFSIVKERLKFNKDKCNNLSKNMNMETGKKNFFFKEYFDTDKNNEKQIYNYTNRGINTLDLLSIPNNIKIKSKQKTDNKFSNGERISFNNNIKYNLDLGYHWNKETENYKDTNQEKNKFEYNMFASRLGHKSTKNIYKTKINSFNKQSNNYYKKITLKGPPTLNIYKNGIYEKNKQGRINNCSEKIKRNLSYKKKPDNNYNDNKKKRCSNNYNSLDIEKLRKIDINKTKNFNKLEHYDIKNFAKIKEILNCKNYEECLKKINKFSEQKSFIKKIFSLYQKCGGTEKIGDNYQNCLLWINNLIRERRQQKSNNNKYEEFCKRIMKENNIRNFSVFQLFVQNAFNEKKNENNFLEDIKKILSVEDCILTERNKDINKNLIKKGILEENKENIINNNLNLIQKKK